MHCQADQRADDMPLVSWCCCLRAARTESGAKQLVGSSGGKAAGGKRGEAAGATYQKWAKATKNHVAATGAAEDSGAAGKARALATRFHPSKRHTSWKAAAAPAAAAGAARRGGELKSEDQVRPLLPQGSSGAIESAGILQCFSTSATVRAAKQLKGNACAGHHGGRCMA